jgi:GTP cyclohydrolase I
MYRHTNSYGTRKLGEPEVTQWADTEGKGPPVNGGQLTYGVDYARVLLEVHAGLKDDPHGEDTPSRFISMLEELTQCRPVTVGQSMLANELHLKDCIKWKTFDSVGDEMVIVEKIPFVSVCNHHVLPFMGYADIGYVPNGKLAGLSKFARVVRHFARQLQLQERLTTDIAEFLEHHLEPAGLAVVLRAEHMCMTIRGIQSPGTITTTSAMWGVFGEHDRTAKAEFLQMTGGK